MSAPERNDELESFLARRSLLPPELAQHENAQPPAQLDRAVLAQARATIEPPKRHSLPRSSRWMVPVALAATIVLSLAIVIELQRPTARDATAVMADREAPPTATVRSERFEPESSDAAATRAAERLEKSAAPPAQSRLPAASAESRALLSSRNRAVPMESQAAAAAESAETATAASARAPAPPEAEADSRITSDPRAWLERIERLRTDGATEQAEREWQAFRKRYPDYVIESVTK